HRLAPRRELRGVREEVGHDLHHPVAVDADPGAGGGAAQDQLDPELAGVGLAGLHGLLQQGVQVDGTEVEGHRARLDALEVEQVVDEADQPLAVPVGRVEQALALGVEVPAQAALEQVQRAVDRGERRAHLVADDGDEVVLLLLHPLLLDELVLRALEVLEGGAEAPLQPAVQVAHGPVRLLVAAPRQLERRQEFREELRGALGDVGAVFGGAGGDQRRQQRLLVQGRHLQHAHADGDRVAADLVRAEEGGLAAVPDVLVQRDRVLARDLVEAGAHGSHLRTETVVPRPDSLVISKSSISRRTPGRPRPRPGPVEKPALRAADTAAIPGPSSRATMTMPGRPSTSSWLSTISPVAAYSMMLRASSEIAVAITVRSLPANPSAAARARPRCRAVTMSAEELIGTTLWAGRRGSRRGLLDMARPRHL